MVADIMDVAQSVLDADTLLMQYERDAGKVVRRERVLSETESETFSVVKTGVRPVFPAFSSNFGQGLPTAVGRVIRVDKQYVKRWFSGAFTYYLPTGYHSRNELIKCAQRANRLFGLSITPEVLWNVAPWSWAVDWVSNVGDVISNATDWAKDGLVLRYGYMMEHSRASRTYIYDGPVYYAGCPHPPPLTLVVETKKRVQANPFGFGVTWGGLSPRQLSILAALGISRGK